MKKLSKKSILILAVMALSIGLVSSAWLVFLTTGTITGGNVVSVSQVPLTWITEFNGAELAMDLTTTNQSTTTFASFNNTNGGLTLMTTINASFLDDNPIDNCDIENDCSFKFQRNLGNPITLTDQGTFSVAPNEVVVLRLETKCARLSCPQHFEGLLSLAIV